MARTGRSSRGDNGTVETSLGDNVNLDGWVSTRVVDLTSVDLGDRHDDAFWRREELALDVGEWLVEWYERGRTNFYDIDGKVRDLKRKLLVVFRRYRCGW